MRALNLPSQMFFQKSHILIFEALLQQMSGKSPKVTHSGKTTTVTYYSHNSCSSTVTRPSHVIRSGSTTTCIYRRGK